MALAGTTETHRISPHQVDFSANPAKVKLVVESHRLFYHHLHNPSFATEIARIDPLPYRWIVVYERMLGRWPLRFLLAAGSGAGKTVLAGLYVLKMFLRRRIHRVLIFSPVGLVDHWCQ